LHENSKDSTTTARQTHQLTYGMDDDETLYEKETSLVGAYGCLMHPMNNQLTGGPYFSKNQWPNLY